MVWLVAVVWLPVCFLLGKMSIASPSCFFLTNSLSPYLRLQLGVETLGQVSALQGLGHLGGPEHLAAGYHHLTRPRQHPLGAGLLRGAKSTTLSTYKEELKKHIQ